MFSGSKWRISRQKSIPCDCIICATRPALYLNQLNVCQADFYCSHSKPPSAPQFIPSATFKIINVLCCILSLIGIVNNIQQIDGKLNTKHLLLIIESLINLSTIVVNVLCLVKNHIKIRESHGLITLIDKKTAFGISEVLSTSSASKIHATLLFIVLLLLLEELISFCRIIVENDFDFQLVVRVCAIEILIFCNASIGLYVLQFLSLYHSIFERCYEELKKCMNMLGYFDTNRLEKTRNYTLKIKPLEERLRKLQRFYMSLRRNLKLNESFIQPGVLIIYTIEVCLLLISYTYLVVLYIERDLILLKFDFYVIAKSMALVLVFCIFCYEAQRILNMNQEILSSLFKCPTTKLSPVEFAQVEMIIETLIIQKPKLGASNIFTVGTQLLASVTGTVITYALVALQFRAILSEK